MIRHGYTFIIAPHTAKPQKSFHVPAWLLNVLLSILMLTVSAVSLHVGNMLYQYKTMEDEVVPTREENIELHSTNDSLNSLLSDAYSSINELQARLAGERESYATGLAQITTKLINLEKFAVDLKLMAGYRLESKEAKTLGTGGPVLDEKTFIHDFLALPETRFVSAGKLTEKDLLGRETQLLSAMNELSEWLQKKACILADVPKGLPVRGIITSPFGARRGGGLHVGLDIAAPEGTPIFAPADGVVVEAGPAAGYGNVIILDHGGGFTTRYGHMSRIKVKKGDRVDAGDVIGSVGHVGWATGNHLHYEVRLNGVPLDPARYIPKGLPVQLMDGSKSMFNESEVGSAIGELEGGIQMEGDQFVPAPLEGDSSLSPLEKKAKPSVEKKAPPLPKAPEPTKTGEGN
jgi:murein DD-endopeptidase MepM/ murein hydrolase activator NlpD